MTTITPDKTTSEREVREAARKTAASLAYSTGFGNEHSSEAVPGALPKRINPQRAPYGLYTELLSETAFPETRYNTRRTYTYRIRPSVVGAPFKRVDNGTFHSPPFTQIPLEPNLHYWLPRPAPTTGTDFVSGLWTLGGNGNPALRSGMAIHLYTADTSMTDRVFSSVDSQLLIIAELGSLLIHTELGLLSVQPGQVALIPRGMQFRVDIQGAAEGEGGPAFVRGYVCENYGSPFCIPELGFMGTTGMANPRDFRAPVAAYDDRERPVEVIKKIGGNLFSAVYDHSPLDVVAWHGNSVPYVYDLRDFMVMGATNFDHADPSRFTALTSPTSTPGAGNVDFCAAPPEWFATEDTMRLQYFHRNVSSEFIGVIEQSAVPGGLLQGAAALANMFTPHGAPAAAWQLFEDAGPEPVLRDGLLFVFETQWPVALTSQAAQTTSETDDEQLSGRNTAKRRFRR